MPPAHWLDQNGIRALKELDFNYVLDGFGFRDYHYRGINFVPQLFSGFQNLLFGQYCTCFHINNYSFDQIDNLVNSVLRYKSYIIQPDQRKSSKLNHLDIVARYGIRKTLFTIRKVKKIVKARV